MTSVVAKATVLSSAPSLPEPLFPVPFRRMVLPWEHPGTEKLRLETATLQTFSFMKRNKPDAILRKKKKKTSFFPRSKLSKLLATLPPQPLHGHKGFHYSQCQDRAAFCGRTGPSVWRAWRSRRAENSQGAWRSQWTLCSLFISVTEYSCALNH